jgi:hypothetical protein
MRTQLAILSLLLLSIGAACNGPRHVSTASPRPDPAFARAAAAAPTVFEGSVVAAGAAPPAWSGRYAVYQEVTYRVERIVADPDHRLSVGAELTVRHLLVAGSETADTRPRLRAALVQPGASVIVLARWSDDGWAGVDEHHGLVVADAAHRAALPVR